MFVQLNLCPIVWRSSSFPIYVLESIVCSEPNWGGVMPKFGHVDVNSNLKTISSSRLASRLTRTKLGGVLPILDLGFSFFSILKPNWGGVMHKFQIWMCSSFESVQVDLCLKISNRVLVTKRRSVSLSATISLVRFRYERRFNSCLSTLECYDRISACEIHVKRSGERGADK